MLAESWCSEVVKGFYLLGLGLVEFECHIAPRQSRARCKTPLMFIDAFCESRCVRAVTCSLDVLRYLLYLRRLYLSTVYLMVSVGTNGWDRRMVVAGHYTPHFPD